MFTLDYTLQFVQQATCNWFGQMLEADLNVGSQSLILLSFSMFKATGDCDAGIIIPFLL